MGSRRGAKRGQTTDVRVADAEVAGAAIAAPAPDRVTALRDTLGNRGMGALLTQRAAQHLSIVKITAFQGRLDSAQATLSDGSFAPIVLSKNALPPGTFRFERDESESTHYRQVEQEGVPIADFLWLPKTVIGDSQQRAEAVEVEIIPGTPETLRAGLAELDPAVQHALISNEGTRTASYSDLERTLTAGHMLQQFGVTGDELELLEYRAEEERAYGREPAQAVDPVEWASNIVWSRQVAGQAALENRGKMMAAREQIDALPPEFANVIRMMAARNSDASWRLIETSFLRVHDIRLSDVISAFETELRSVTQTFLSQGLLALHKIEKLYLAKRNVGVERGRLQRAMEAVRPAVFLREAGHYELLRQQAMRMFGEGSKEKVSEWTEEVARRDRDLERESQAAKLPVAAWKGFDPDLILDRNVDAALEGLRVFVADARSRLQRAERLSSDIKNLYKSDKMVAMAKNAIGIKPGSLLGDVISFRAKRETADDGFWSTLWDVVTLALMFVPGNIGIALRIGAGVINASNAAEEYSDARTRSLTGLSSEDPSSLSFYLAVGGTLIDAQQMAKGVFQVAGQEAKAASALGERAAQSETTVAREGEQTAATLESKAPAETVTPRVETPEPVTSATPVEDIPSQAPHVEDTPSLAPDAPAPTVPSVKPITPPADDPLVWVNTKSGSGRGRYHPEGTRYFQNTKEGVTMPEWQAKDLGFVRAGTPRSLPPPPMEPMIVNGRQAESLGATAGKSPKSITATARAESAVTTTSIRPDLNESMAYKKLITDGELGLQRPLGSNVPGVDAITVQVERDLAGKPVGAKIFVNDMTTPTAGKSLALKQTWLQEVDEAVAAGRLDFGDPELERVIREAAAKDVYVRIVRVDPARGVADAVTIDPNEVRRVSRVAQP